MSLGKQVVIPPKSELCNSEIEARIVIPPTQSRKELIPLENILDPKEPSLSNGFHAKPKKRLQKCGVCAPCQLINNCGACISCINRKKGKQVCALRKCDKIKKLQLIRKKNHKSKKELKVQLEKNIWKQNEFLLATPTNIHHNRKTPEIFEPRKGLESEEILKKKVTPVKTDGIIAELPSIRTFCNNSRKGISPYKRKIPLLKDKLRKKKKEIKTSCGCNVDEEQHSGPFYVHLGSAKTIDELKTKIKGQLHVNAEEIRFVSVTYTTKEGKNGDGCPLARWVIRRSDDTEKYLVVYKHNVGHNCDGAISIIALVAWQGISNKYADDMYQFLTTNLNTSGFKTRRRCGTNDSKTCMCQGDNEDTDGASFTFGCSWSIFFNGCKFAKSVNARKYKMQDTVNEEQIKKVLEDMATNVSPLLSIWAPKAYQNMTKFENVAGECRIGKCNGRPFSGVTCCVDFCAHSHKDMHNMPSGTTMVCTLLKPDYNERDDEQLHVLPLYQLRDEKGNIAPINYEIPEHFLHSKLQERVQIEKKGKYVMPTKVCTNKSPLKSDTRDHHFKSHLIPDIKAESNKNFNALEVSFKDENKIAKLTVNNIDLHSINTVNNNMVLPNGSSVDETTQNGTEEDDQNFTNQDLINKPTHISSDMGGVAIALTHGSFLIECAKKELHATTALRNPTRNKPTRISMVFYQHKKLQKANHGFHEYQQKMKERVPERRQSNAESSDLLDSVLANLKNDCSISLDVSIEETPENLNPLQLLSQQEKATSELKTEESTNWSNITEKAPIGAPLPDHPPSARTLGFKQNSPVKEVKSLEKHYLHKSNTPAEILFHPQENNPVINRLPKFYDDKSTSKSRGSTPLTFHQSYTLTSPSKSITKKSFYVDQLLSPSSKKTSINLNNTSNAKQTLQKLPNFSIFSSSVNKTSQPITLKQSQQVVQQEVLQFSRKSDPSSSFQNHSFINSNSSTSDIVLKPGGVDSNFMSKVNMVSTAIFSEAAEVQTRNHSLANLLSKHAKEISDEVNLQRQYTHTKQDAFQKNEKQHDGNSKNKFSLLRPRNTLLQSNQQTYPIESAKGNLSHHSTSKPCSYLQPTTSSHLSLTTNLKSHDQYLPKHCLSTSSLEEQMNASNKEKRFAPNTEPTFQAKWLEYYSKLLAHRQNSPLSHTAPVIRNTQEIIDFGEFCKQNLPAAPQKDVSINYQTISSIQQTQAFHTGYHSSLTHLKLCENAKKQNPQPQSCFTKNSLQTNPANQSHLSRQNFSCENPLKPTKLSLSTHILSDIYPVKFQTVVNSCMLEKNIGTLEYRQPTLLDQHAAAWKQLNPNNIANEISFDSLFWKKST